jgi:hypothetical protein
MRDLSSSVSEFAGAVRGFLGLTPHSRLREQLRDSLGLFVLAKQHPELTEATDDLVKVIKVQATRLLALVDPDRPRRWDWGTFAVGLTFTAGLLWAEWTVWHHRNNWWGIPLLIFTAFWIVVFLIVSFQALFQRRSLTA